MLTEKGKWYRLTQNVTERKKPYQGNLNTNGKDRNTYMFQFQIQFQFIYLP